MVKVFLAKIDKRLLDLTLSKIIMDYGGWTIFAKTFAVVEYYDLALCQHDATDLVSLLMDYSEYQRIHLVAVGLAETRASKTSYCWFCGELHHAKKDFSL